MKILKKKSSSSSNSSSSSSNSSSSSSSNASVFISCEWKKEVGKTNNGVTWKKALQSMYQEESEV
jgi:hypothetical protein